MQKFPKAPTLAKAIRRTLSVMLSFAVECLEWMPQNSVILPKRKGRQEGARSGSEAF